VVVSVSTRLFLVVVLWWYCCCATVSGGLAMAQESTVQGGIGGCSCEYDVVVVVVMLEEDRLLRHQVALTQGQVTAATLRNSTLQHDTKMSLVSYAPG